MEKVLLNSIFIISLSIFIALIAGTISYRRLNIPLKIMCGYTWFSTLLGGVISIMSMKGINNILLVNIYALIEFVIMISVFYIVFDFKKRIFLFLFIIAITVVLGIYLVETLKNPYEYNNAMNSAISIIMVVVSVGYLITQFYKGELEGDKKPMLLLAVGTFMYFASTFLIVLTGSDNSLLNRLQVLWIYLIHSIFYLIFVIILTIAFLICREQSEHLNL
jgi:hypothetical protein